MDVFNAGLKQALDGRQRKAVGPSNYFNSENARGGRNGILTRRPRR